MKKRVLGLALVLILVLSTGCGVFVDSPKTFTKSGLSITLTEAFSEKEYVTFTAYYLSSNMMVTALKEEFSLFDGMNLTLDEYAQLVIEANSLDAEVSHENGLVCFTFQQAVNGKDFSYLAAVYEAEDAYWLVQLGCESGNFEKLKDEMVKYAQSVEV